MINQAGTYAYKDSPLTGEFNFSRNLSHDLLGSPLTIQPRPSLLRINPGDFAPSFNLLNAVGDIIKLTELLNEGRIVLLFYQGGWSPYCNLQLSDFQQVLKEIYCYGAQLVTISPQNPQELLDTRARNDLHFEMLSDPGNHIARKYTLVSNRWNRSLNRVKNQISISTCTRELPIPTVFIIEKSGQVSFAQAMGPNPQNRVKAGKVLDALSRCQ